MDKDTFWNEVKSMIKRHRQSLQPVEELSEQQMTEMKSTVYAHIEHLFPEADSAEATAGNDAANTAANKKISKTTNTAVPWLTRLKRVLSELMPEAQSGLPVTAIAMLTIVSLGVLTFLQVNKSGMDTYIDLPKSVATAGLEDFIEVPQEGSMALTSELPSDRRKAFVTGIAKAELDVISDNEAPAAREVAAWYQRALKNNSVSNADNALGLLESNLAVFSENEALNYWLEQGYTIELVLLAARRSITNMRTGTLTELLQLYEEKIARAEAEDNNKDVAPQYFSHSRKLIAAAQSNVSTPDQVQDIIDTANSMKVLVQ